MKKEILVVPSVTSDESSDTFNESSMSEDLKKAIENLIFRMREIGPIENN